MALRIANHQFEGEMKTKHPYAVFMTWTSETVKKNIMKTIRSQSIDAMGNTDDVQVYMDYTFVTCLSQPKTGVHLKCYYSIVATCTSNK